MSAAPIAAAGAGRAFLVVLDSVGIGGAPDAARFGDEGANTLGHIAEACAAGAADRAGLRSGGFRIPNLAALGLLDACALATGRRPPAETEGAGIPEGVAARWGAAAEISNGKDTPSGHWEIAGAPVRFDWGYFPRTEPAFPRDLTDALIARCGLPGLLGNRHASGTEIIEALGAEHLRTGAPIAYTSVDSVLQIAAHEEAFGLERLYEVCRVARELVDPLNIGRVIARPFIGAAPGAFQRTKNRRDYATPPHEETLLDRAAASGREVISIGKIEDIFAGRGTGEAIRTASDAEGVDATLVAMGRLRPGGLAFTNLVDFDSLHGHRRDVAGYAAALEAFDRRLPELLGALRHGDLLILTADHGNDPTAPGTDHTREMVPALAASRGGACGSIGLRESFADIGQTIAAHLGLAPLRDGRAWA